MLCERKCFDRKSEKLCHKFHVLHMQMICHILQFSVLAKSLAWIFIAFITVHRIKLNMSFFWNKASLSFIMESIFSIATFVVTPSCHVKFSSCANELNQLKILQGDIQHLRVCIPKLIRYFQIYIDTIFKIKVIVIIPSVCDPWLTYFWPPLILLHNIRIFLHKRLTLLSIESIVKLKSCFKLIAKFDFSNNNVVTFTTMCQAHKPQQFPTKYNT